jgi:hypothetical protein
VTPQGKIWIALYAERPALPRVVGYAVPSPEDMTTPLHFDEKAAGKPTFIDSRPGNVRHVELSAYVDLEVAEKLRTWLGERIADLKNATELAS